MHTLSYTHELKVAKVTQKTETLSYAHRNLDTRYEVVGKKASKRHEKVSERQINIVVVGCLLHLVVRVNVQIAHLFPERN